MSSHQISKGESSRWVPRPPQREDRNTTQIFIYCSTRPQNALDSGVGQKESLPNTLGINENHSSQGVWGRRKNKKEQNRDKGENISKVPSLGGWQWSGGTCPLAVCGSGCCGTCTCHTVSDWHTAAEGGTSFRGCSGWWMGSETSSGLSANPTEALSWEGTVLIVLVLFHCIVSTIIVNEYGGQWGRSPGLGFQWITANRKQEETLIGQQCKTWQNVWQSPEGLHISWLILFI